MLDMKTILLSGIVSNALLTLFIALLWQQNRKRFDGLTLWLVGYVLQTAGFLLLLLLIIIPDVISIVVGNTMIVSGVLLIYIGLERFVGRPRADIHNYLIIFIFVCLMSYFTVFVPDIDIRTIIVHTALSLLTLQCAWLMLRGVAPSLRPITQSVGLVFFIYALVALTRTVHLMLRPIPAAAFLFELPTGQVTYVLIFQMLNVVLTFALILMVTRRLANDFQKQEQRYASLYNSMQEGMALHEIIYDKNGSATDYRILDVNPAYERILGLKKKHAVGQIATKLYHANDAPYLNIYANVAATRESTSFDTYFPIMNKYFSISAFSPEPGLFATIFEDITERKKSQQELEKLNELLFERALELKESEDKFKGVFETSRDFMFISTLDGKILDNNESARDFFGYSSDEIQSMNMMDLYAYPEERKSFKELVIEKGYVENYELKLKKKDNTIIDCQITVVIRKDRNGDIIGFQGSVRDMTERRKMEQRLLQSEKLSTIGTMISGVAHELNNPLTSIIGNAQLLMRKSIPDEIRTKLEVIFKESKRSAGIVSGLLAFAREHRPQRTPTDINIIVSESLKLREYDMKVSNINVRLSLAEDLPETLCDPFQLQQVFLNLINNARDALTGKDGGALIIRTHQKQNEILIEFEDNGPGIPDELVKRIFDPFFTTKQVGKGTGLGLSMSYGIINEHGGLISVESQPDRGTKFIVALPIVSLEKETAHAARGDERSPHKRGSQDAASILIVEDETSLSRMICEALVNEGYRVDYCDTGEAAIEILKKNRYDLIISDMKMPGMTGKELYLYIQKYYPVLVKKVLFMTGDVLGGDTQGFLKMAGNRHIEKPFEINELLGIVHEIVE